MSQKCYLCDSKDHKVREGSVRDNSELKVHECNDCGLVFLSSFNHIEDQFYEESRMLNGKVEIEKYRKQSKQDDERRYDYVKNLIWNKELLDFGCGAGGFLSLAKNTCSSVSGIELDKTINKYLNEIEGIKVFESIKELRGFYDIITLFHVLEHLPNPVEILTQLSSSLNEDGEIIVEVPSSNDVLLTLYQNEEFSNFTYWSCHLFLFNELTLSRIAKKAGLKINYIKHIQRYPLSNHLYWLSKGKPGGHQIWDFLDSKELNNAYETQLASLGLTDTLIASFSKV